MACQLVLSAMCCLNTVSTRPECRRVSTRKMACAWGGALVHPAGGHLAAAGDADLQARGVGQVDEVVDHAVLLAPLGLATGAGGVVAFSGLMMQLSHWARRLKQG